MRLMTIIALILCSFATFASDMVARKVSFTYFGRDGWSTTYYSCDSARSMMRERLQDLGARNIRVTCSGGIDAWGGSRDGWSRGDFAMPVSLTARFRVNSNRDNAQRIVIKDSGRNSNCDFNVQLMRKLLANMPNARMVSRSSNCRGSDGRYSFTVDASL